MRLTKAIWLLVCTAALAAHGQSSATNGVRPVSLQECVRLALLNNRQVQIQRFNPQIARLTLSSTYGAYDPVFNSGYRHTTESDSGGYNPATLARRTEYSAQSHLAEAGFTGTTPIGMSYDLLLDYANTYGSRSDQYVDSYDVGAGVSISQHLLKDFWVDETRTTIQVSKRDLKITELGVDYVVMDIITQVQKAYNELTYTHEFVKVQRKLLEVRQRFYDETQQKIQMGRLAPLEAKLAQAQVAQVAADLISASNAVALAENLLKTLIGDDFVSSVNTVLMPSDPLVVVPEKFDLGESWRQGVARRPDLAQLKLDVEKAELDLKFRYNQLFPALDLVAGYGAKGSDVYVPSTSARGGAYYASAAGAFGEVRGLQNPNDLLGVIFSMPLTRRAERDNYRASRIRKDQAAVLVKQRQELVLREIDDAIKTARTSLQRVAATREAVDYARAALEAEEKKLAAGTSTSFVVLQLQSDLAQRAVEELRAKADYNIAVAQLRFVEASVLDHHKVKVEIK